MTALRVLTYNLHSQRDDSQALAAVVRDLAPDIAILQEAPRRLLWRQKCAALARSFGMVVGEGGLPSLGNLILIGLRVRVRESWSIRYPLTPGRHMRGAAFLRGQVGHAGFVVAGSHLSTDAGERPAQAALLKQELSRVGEPVIFGGDLNENSGGGAWRMLADGLVDSAVAAERHERPTYSCADPRERIDVIFVDPGLEIVDYDIVDTPAARAASDHFPVVVDLRFP